MSETHLSVMQSRCEQCGWNVRVFVPYYGPIESLHGDIVPFCPQCHVPLCASVEYGNCFVDDWPDEIYEC
jgi:hypothetical protein